MKTLMSTIALAIICTLSGMLSTFHKYQSLGNHFVILDWLEYDQDETKTLLASPEWQPIVKRLCCPKTGVGADSVLIILSNDNKFTMRIFNRDGSEAENCLNGARCVASYLINQKNIPRPLDLCIGQTACRFTVNDSLIVTENIVARSCGTITLNVDNSMITYPPLPLDPHAVYASCDELRETTEEPGHPISRGYLQPKEKHHIIEGTIADVGNPHLIIFSHITHETLKTIGPLLEHHPAFPNRTNIEWVWPDERQPNTFHMLIHERGVGPTDACSSGVAAALGVLYQHNKISKLEDISIAMPGGTISGSIQADGKITLRAPAFYLFSGTLSSDFFS